MYKNLLDEIPTGILIVDRNKKVKLANRWMQELLPVGTCEKRVSPSSNGLDNGNQHSEVDVEDLMNQVRSLDGRHTLFECINEPGGRELLENIEEFEYRQREKVHRFAIKQYEVQFIKELCTAVVIDDHTSMHELAELSEKYRKILLASVVHDIRTPIQGILGALEQLDTPQRTEEEKGFIELGRNTCHLLEFLTYDITDLGQLEAGRLQANQKAFSALAAAQDCVTTLSFAYEHKGIHLNLRKLGEDEMMAYSDRHRYMQIMINLLGNALKFTIKGSVTVTLSADLDRDLIVTEVRDNGIGIKEEEIPCMFKLFGKLASGASLNPNGVGLGLTICKRLSEALGGSISVQSRYGEGSTFTFSVKANSSQLRPAPAESNETFKSKCEELKFPPLRKTSTGLGSRTDVHQTTVYNQALISMNR